MMPTTGPLKVVQGPESGSPESFRSHFRHETETASPGYYAVTLDDYRIRGELTTTTRAGFQRYRGRASRRTVASSWCANWIPRRRFGPTSGLLSGHPTKAEPQTDLRAFCRGPRGYSSVSISQARLFEPRVKVEWL